jgi:hypothetical protein
MLLFFVVVIVGTYSSVTQTSKNAGKFLLQLEVYKFPRHFAADFWLITSSGRTHEDMNVGIPCCPGHVGGRVRCVARPTCAVNRAFQDDVFVFAASFHVVMRPFSVGGHDESMPILQSCFHSIWGCHDSKCFLPLSSQ